MERYKFFSTYDGPSVISGFPIRKIYDYLKRSYGGEVKVDTYEDLISFTDGEGREYLAIERVPRKIYCNEYMREFLINDLNFTEDMFLR
jgi:hypothetical protein